MLCYEKHGGKKQNSIKLKDSSLVHSVFMLQITMTKAQVKLNQLYFPVQMLQMA